MHRAVAAFALIAHLVFMGFTIIGGFLAWMAPWLVMPHLAAAAWGSRMAVTETGRCPLSRLENWGRSGSGRPPLHDEGFIAHYFEGRVYPQRWARRVPIVVGSVVVGSWVGFAVR